MHLHKYKFNNRYSKSHFFNIIERYFFGNI